MNRRCVLALLVSVSVLLCNYAAAHVLDRPPNYTSPNLKEPHDVVSVFLIAVDRKELIVFDLVFDRDMIKPSRVEYVYELDSPIPTIKVYSELKQAISVPHHEDCEIRGISAVVSADGRIIESTAHVWPK